MVLSGQIANGLQLDNIMELMSLEEVSASFLAINAFLINHVFISLSAVQIYDLLNIHL